MSQLGVQLLLTCLVVALASGFTFTKWRDDVWNKAPGFKARITQNGLNFLRDVGLQMLRTDIQKMTIPDIHGLADVGIGHIEYDVTSMHITSFSIPTASLTTNPSAGGLKLTASGVELSIHGNWHYKTRGFIHISDSGSFDATASSISLGLTLRIGVDSTGRPSISSQSSDCSFNVGRMSVKFHGGASWLYNLFDDKIADKLRSSLNDQVCQTVINAVNTDLENEMKTLEVVAPFLNVAEIDYSLVESPVFNASINTAHKGEVYPLANKTECPLPVQPIPADADVSRMVFLWITEYLPNSAGYVLQNIGYLQYNVTPDNVPEAEKPYLNTNNFALKFVIPQLNKMYPNMPMQINVNSTAAPAVSINPDGTRVTMVGDWSPYAIMPNKTLAFLFTLRVTLKAAVNVDFDKNNITWNLSSFTTDMSLVTSEVGYFSTLLLETAINSAITLYFQPYLNKMGAVGIPLPQMDDFEFAKPVITQGQGFIKIGTDLTMAQP